MSIVTTPSGCTHRWCMKYEPKPVQIIEFIGWKMTPWLIFLKKADEAFAQFDASGDDELDYKVEPGSLLSLISNSGKQVFHVLGVLPDDPQEAARRGLNFIFFRNMSEKCLALPRIQMIVTQSNFHIIPSPLIEDCIYIKQPFFRHRIKVYLGQFFSHKICRYVLTIQNTMLVIERHYVCRLLVRCEINISQDV